MTNRKEKYTLFTRYALPSNLKYCTTAVNHPVEPESRYLVRSSLSPNRISRADVFTPSTLNINFNIIVHRCPSGRSSPSCVPQYVPAFIIPSVCATCTAYLFLMSTDIRCSTWRSDRPIVYSERPGDLFCAGRLYFGDFSDVLSPRIMNIFITEIKRYVFKHIFYKRNKSPSNNPVPDGYKKVSVVTVRTRCAPPPQKSST